jgi:hypothetical protein
MPREQAVFSLKRPGRIGLPYLLRPGPQLLFRDGPQDPDMADDAPQPIAEQYRERAQLLRSAVKNMRTVEGRRSFLDIAHECEQVADRLDEQG